MIFGNQKQEEAYRFLPQTVLACFDYAKTHDLAGLEPGSYPIDGDRLFVNIVEYETTKAKNRFWEAHRAYLDVHYLLQGTEQIDLNFIENMDQKDYVEAEDFLPLEGVLNSLVVLRPGDFLVCYPQDGHRTAVAFEQPQKVKKAIFKVKIENK